ncbi:MAG: glycosyltransferase, partial [Gemmobacter sp.]
YHGGALLRRCLAALAANPPSRPWEVVVYDNASADDSRAMMAAEFPWVQVIEGGENLGLCRAFNRGAAAARGAYVLSLDSDTEVLAGAIDDMAAWLDADPGTGACGSTLVYPDGTPQRTARAFPTPMAALFGRRSRLTALFPNNPFSRRYMMADLEGSSEPYPVDTLSTACMMVRRGVIDTVGAYDEAYFVYWSDADWCHRIKKAGWAIVTLPTSTVIHNENIKAGHRKVRRTRMVMDFHRGAYRYYSTHHAGPLNPMRYVAWVGLHARAGVMLAADEWRRLRGAATGHGGGRRNA